MLRLCQLRKEDWEKFKQDQKDPDVIERGHAEDIGLTVRSKAAKTIEKIASKLRDPVQSKDAVGKY